MTTYRNHADLRAPECTPVHQKIPNTRAPSCFGPYILYFARAPYVSARTPCRPPGGSEPQNVIVLRSPDFCIHTATPKVELDDMARQE